ncbi:MAG: lysophospholipid acyltransferase family protein [Geminicoccaceae bacterium]
MLAIRSLLFNILFFSWTILYMIVLLPLTGWYLKGKRMRRIARFWTEGVHFLLRVIIGLDHRIIGRERVPDGPVLFASKHQSAWETLVVQILSVQTVIGLKYELSRVPLFGRYLILAGSVVIDRGGASKAIRSLVRGAKKAVSQGLNFMIFPEGTRRPVGAEPDYKPGVAALYHALDVPCVPIALNSGLFWGRRSFIKRPGMITLEILDPIEPGLDRKTFMKILEERIEAGTDRLVAEAGGNPGPG